MRGTNSFYNKSNNLRLILNLLTKEDGLPRIDIAKRTFLTKQTISNLTETLDKAGLIHELGLKRRGVGKPTTQLSLVANGAFSIGVRVRVNKVEAAIYNLKGEMVSFTEFPIKALEMGFLIQLIEDLCLELIANTKISLERILGLGLILPAPTRFNDTNNPNLSNDILELEKISKNIQVELEKKLKLPVIVENVATAISAKESFYGAAKDLKSFVYIHLGSQIDASFILDQNLFVGYQGAGGRLGHLIVEAEGRECSCGNFGCLNQYASLLALKSMIEKQSRKQIKLSEMFDNQTELEKYLSKWLEDMSEPMRIGLNTIENLFNAETVILGGDAPNWFLDRFIRSLRPFLPSAAQFNNRKLPRLIRAPKEDRDAVKGAATLPIYFALTQEKSELTLNQEQDYQNSPIDRMNDIILKPRLAG